MRTPAHKWRKEFVGRAVAALAAAVIAGAAAAQEPLPAPTGAPPRPLPLTAVTADFVAAPEAPAAPAPVKGEVIQAQCASCGGGGLRPEYLPPPPSDDGCGGNCVPGQKCMRCEDYSGFGRLYCHFYNAFQCPDPCYEPRWLGAANASLFVDPARPANSVRFRWDRGLNLILPDRNEFFWARIGGKGPGTNVRSLDYNELSVYMEAGAEKFSMFTEMPYRNWRGDPIGGGSGFTDLIVGTKTLWIDTELSQLTFQFKTYIPTASSGKGIGTGHVSLEPALLLASKIYCDTWFQGMLAEWIPISGDPETSGAFLHYAASLNHVIARPFVDSQFIATLEMQGYCFQDGTFTDPVTGAQLRSGGGNYLYLGPGFRWVISDHCDFGFGVQFAVTERHFASTLYRTELRVRF
jgi:Putative MetA-pathway of phenol degradation